MTSKLSWIFFVPFAAAAVFFKLAQTLLEDGMIFGLSDMMLDYVAVGCAAVILVAAAVLCAVDRKISPYYLPHRNIPAGIFGLLLALVCAADGANRIYRVLSSGTVDAMEIVEAALLLLTSVVFIVMGLTHSFANRDNKIFALFNVMPALLCAIRLVRCFIGITTISLTQADITLMFCYVFATMFFFNFAVTISLIEAKHAVKSCFIFGFPAVAMLLARGAAGVVNDFDTHDLFANAEIFELCLMAVYALAFLLEMTIFIKDRDHVVIDGDGREYQELDETDVRTDDNYVVTGMDDENRLEPDNGYLNSPDFEDYLYRAVDKPEEDETLMTQADASGYITDVVEDPAVDSTPVRTEVPEPAPAEAESFGYNERLDEIDKLIMELTADEND